MNILRSALGYYEPVGRVEEADCIIAHSFGTVLEPGSANDLLVAYVMEYAFNRPIIADRMLVKAIPNGDEVVALAVEGSITNAVGKGVGNLGSTTGRKRLHGSRRSLQAFNSCSRTAHWQSSLAS